MHRLNAILDKLSPTLTYVAGFLMAVAPMWKAPYVPHLVEKLMMLANGTLIVPIDIFDLVMHGSITLVALLKLWRELTIPADEKAARDAAAVAKPRD